MLGSGFQCTVVEFHFRKVVSYRSEKSNCAKSTANVSLGNLGNALSFPNGNI